MVRKFKHEACRRWPEIILSWLSTALRCKGRFEFFRKPQANQHQSVSPSAYIAFPAISAFDACGTLGSMHNSTTLAYAPGQLSTIVFSSEGSYAFSFDLLMLRVHRCLSIAFNISTSLVIPGTTQLLCLHQD